MQELKATEMARDCGGEKERATLRVGVVGLGLGRLHVEAYAGAEAVARLVVCDADAGHVEATRARIPAVAAGYPDLDAMLEAESLDAVSILTPDHLHRPHVERCLQAGCHVLVTKPMATNLADARAMIRAAEAAGRTLMVAHEKRFQTRTRAIRDLLDSGDLGQIIHLSIDDIQDKRRQFRDKPWYAAVETGRSAMVGTGIHAVDLLRFLMGRPIESVFAFSNRLGSLEFPQDKTITAVYRFEGGAIGQVTLSYEAHWPRAGAAGEGFRLIATRGMIVGNRYTRDGQDDWQELPGDKQATATGSRGCVEGFLASIANGSPVPVSGPEAFASQAACVAADTSAATGRATVPETIEG